MRKIVVSLFLVMLSLAAPAQDRIQRSLDTGERQPVAGNVHPLARRSLDEGAADGARMLHRMVLAFKPSAAQQAGLDALLQEQQNPLSPLYHQWLTPEQYADRFGLSHADLEKVVGWLQAQGFTIDERARSRTYVAFSGTVAQVQAAFGTAIHRYVLDGQDHYANVSDPVLPAPLAQVTLSLRGLNDFRPRPRAVRHAWRPLFTSGLTGSHYLAPDDLATIYSLQSLYANGINGAGQKLAVMGQTDLVMSDISTFRSLSGLPASTPTVMLAPGSADPGVVSADLAEADLDVEWAGAVARNATIIYVNAKNIFDSLSYAISQNLAPVLSISYGDCEPNYSAAEISSLMSMGQQANAQGQTIVAPSGDSGAADCDYPPDANSQVTSATHGLAVDVPAALPYATAIGGTRFNEGTGNYWSPTNNASNGSALSYIPEVAWNDTAFEITHGGSLSASGGGVSTLFSKPSWQTGPGVPNDSRRDVPDISFTASLDHDGYLVCSNSSCVNGFRASDGSLLVVGGTSAGVPVFAGMVALLNHATGAAQGNVNPRLYQLAAASPGVFHDITTGDNKVPCTSGSKDCPSGGTIGYTAAAGYDLVTGLGSVDAASLAAAWSEFTLSLSATSLTLTAGPSGNVGTVNLTVAPVGSFSGSVTLTCSVPASLPGTTCSVSPTSVTATGGATVTITAPSTHAALPAPALPPRLFPWTTGVFAVAMGAVILGGDKRRARRKLRVAILAALIMTGLALSCGGGGGSGTSSGSNSKTTTSQSGTVVVTASGGTTSRAAAINVTVN